MIAVFSTYTKLCSSNLDLTDESDFNELTRIMRSIRGRGGALPVPPSAPASRSVGNGYDFSWQQLGRNADKEAIENKWKYLDSKRKKGLEKSLMFLESGGLQRKPGPVWEARGHIDRFAAVSRYRDHRWAKLPRRQKFKEVELEHDLEYLYFRQVMLMEQNASVEARLKREKAKPRARKGGSRTAITKLQAQLEIQKHRQFMLRIDMSKTSKSFVYSQKRKHRERANSNLRRATVIMHRFFPSTVFRVSAWKSYPIRSSYGCFCCSDGPYRYGHIFLPTEQGKLPTRPVIPQIRLLRQRVKITFCCRS